MSSNPISPAVQALIARHIRTVKDLEVLLLLLDRGMEIDAATVGEAMYISPEAAERILSGLADTGLVVRSDATPPTYRYDSANGNDSAVRELASDYGRMRVRVIEMIYGSPDDPLKSFADAFKFRRGKE